MTKDTSSFIPILCKYSLSPSMMALKGCLLLSDGSASDIFLARMNANIPWMTGCSAHNVPSLSKVAMRSAAGIKSGEPSVVVFVTKAMIDSFSAPSFQDGKGSAGTAAGALFAVGLLQPIRTQIPTMTTMFEIPVCFIELLLDQHLIV